MGLANRAALAEAADDQRVATNVALRSIPEFTEYVRTEWKLLCQRRISMPMASIQDLAAGLGFSPQTVRIWLRTPGYQRYENWRISLEQERIEIAVPLPSSRFVQTTVPERFQEYQAEMQERLLDIIETTSSEKLRADLCKDWLAYGGVVPTAKPTEGSTKAPLSVEMLMMFATRAKEAGLDFAIAVKAEGV